jgi:hypothetical protein
MLPGEFYHATSEMAGGSKFGGDATMELQGPVSKCRSSSCLPR